MLRLEVFQQVVPVYFDQIPGDLVDAADLPDHARGLRWKVAVVQGDLRVLVNSHGDVAVDVPVEGGTDLFRLDSDPEGLARKFGFSSFDDLNDALSDVLATAINAARKEQFRSDLSEAEAHAFDALTGPREDMPDELSQKAVDTGLRWIEFVACRHGRLTEEDLDAVLDIAERFEMRQVEGMENVCKIIATIGVGTNVSDDLARRVFEWLARRDEVEAQLGASTRAFVAGMNHPAERRSSVGRRLLDRLNKVFDRTKAEQTSARGRKSTPSWPKRQRAAR